MKEAEALWAVAHYEPATSRDVAFALGSSREDASNILRRIWRQGFISRESGTDGYEYRLSEDYER